MISYSLFLSLISDVTRNRLYDALHPELVKYRRNKYADVRPHDAYAEIMDRAFRFTGGKTPTIDRANWDETVREMQKARSRSIAEYRTDEMYGHWFYFYILFSDEPDDPHYADRVSQSLFGKAFYDQFERDMRRCGISRPDHLPPLEQAHLGPFTVSFGYDTNLLPLHLEPKQKSRLVLDGEPNIYAALHWTANLSPLVGRDDEKRQILEWANAEDDKHVKVMLVSGRGGTGKSRLAFEAVSELKSKHNWEGGFLRDVLPDTTTHIQGGSTGTAIIVDYPEERLEETKAILNAAKQADTFRSPVRIILVSREDKGRWAEIVNSHDLSWVEDVNLERKPFVSPDESLTLITEVAKEYAAKLGLEVPAVAEAKAWLQKHESHRLPLFSIAAAVHSVLEPRRAFSLDGKDVLLALALREVERARRFSKRDLGSEKVLEKLVSLSLMTSTGLTSDSLFQLGEMGICEGKDGDQLLEGVRNSPYWANSIPSSGHMMRLEPDLPAAAFMAVALLERPLQKLPLYLGVAAAQSGTKFPGILSRLRFDVPIIEPLYGDALEDCAIKMLEQCPSLLNVLKPDLQRDILISGFWKKYTEMSLELADDKASRAALLTNLAGFEHDSGRMSEAVELWRQSAECYRELSSDGVEEFRPLLASTLSMLAVTLFDLDKKTEAVELSFEAAKIIAGTDQFSTSVVPIVLDTIINHGSILRRIGQSQEAIISLSSAVDMAVSLRNHDRSVGLEKLALIQLAIAEILSESEHVKETIEAGDIALRAFVELARGRLGVFAPRVARAAKILAEKSFEMKKFKDAAAYATLASEVYQRLVSVRPNSPVPDMANWYGSLATMMMQAGELSGALSVASASVNLFSKLVEASGGAPNFLLGLASATDTVASIHANAGKLDLALSKNLEALQFYKELPLPLSDKVNIEYATALSNHANTLKSMGRAIDALKSCEKSIAQFEAVGFGAHIHNSNFIANFLGALDLKGHLFLSLDQPSLAVDCFSRELVLRQCADGTETTSIEIIGTMLNLRSAYSLSNQPFAAMGVIKEALKRVTPIFLSQFDSVAQLTGLVLRGYLDVCEEVGIKPDRELVGPIESYFTFG